MFYFTYGAAKIFVHKLTGFRLIGEQPIEKDSGQHGVVTLGFPAPPISSRGSTVKWVTVVPLIWLIAEAGPKGGQSLRIGAARGPEAGRRAHGAGTRLSGLSAWEPTDLLAWKPVHSLSSF